MKLDFKEAYLDVAMALDKAYLWITLGWYDVLARYRRSTLGPVWITLSMVVTICAVSYTHLTLPTIYSV